jgi:hypothetical protein
MPCSTSHSATARFAASIASSIARCASLRGAGRTSIGWPRSSRVNTALGSSKSSEPAARRRSRSARASCGWRSISLRDRVVSGLDAAAAVVAELRAAADHRAVEARPAPSPP